MQAGAFTPASFLARLNSMSPSGSYIFLNVFAGLPMILLREVFFIS
jgi:hypothetical protein